MSGDMLTTDDDTPAGEPLLQQVMAAGKRTSPAPALADIREHAREELERLPDHLRELRSTPSYPVAVGARLKQVAEETDRRLAQMQKEDSP
jgi:nicotinate phosphoribosyltransferase